MMTFFNQNRHEEVVNIFAQYFQIYNQNDVTD